MNGTTEGASKFALRIFETFTNKNAKIFPRILKESNYCPNKKPLQKIYKNMLTCRGENKNVKIRKISRKSRMLGEHC